MSRQTVLSTLRYSISISLLWLCFLCPTHAQQVIDQQPFTDSIGSKAKYAATIEMKKGYISGICILASEDDCYRGVIFNEFGITAIEFTYSKKKVKLGNVIKMLDKWYIKRVLRRDLAQVVENLLNGISTYKDKKYNIEYKFTALDATEE